MSSAWQVDVLHIHIPPRLWLPTLCSASIHETHCFLYWQQISPLIYPLWTLILRWHHHILTQPFCMRLWILQHFYKGQYLQLASCVAGHLRVCAFSMCERFNWYCRSLKTCSEINLTLLLINHICDQSDSCFRNSHLHFQRRIWVSTWKHWKGRYSKLEKYWQKGKTLLAYNAKNCRFWCPVQWLGNLAIVASRMMPSAFQSADMTSFLCGCPYSCSLCFCVCVRLSAMLCCISPWWRRKATWRAALCQRKASVNI